MTLTKDQIIGALPTLSQSDLTAIKAVTVALLGHGLPDAVNGPNGPSAWLFEALAGVLGVSYGLQSGSAKQFNKSAPVFLKFVEEHFSSSLTKKVNGVAVMRTLLMLIIDDLKGRGVPVSLGSVIVNMPRMPEVFDTAFPNYLSSGLAALIIK